MLRANNEEDSVVDESGGLPRARETSCPTQNSVVGRDGPGPGRPSPYIAMKPVCSKQCSNPREVESLPTLAVKTVGLGKTGEQNGSSKLAVEPVAHPDPASLPAQAGGQPGPRKSSRQLRKTKWRKLNHANTLATEVARLKVCGTVSSSALADKSARPGEASQATVPGPPSPRRSGLATEPKKGLDDKQPSPIVGMEPVALETRVDDTELDWEEETETVPEVVKQKKMRSKWITDETATALSQLIIGDHRNICKRCGFTGEPKRVRIHARQHFLKTLCPCGDMSTS